MKTQIQTPWSYDYGLHSAINKIDQRLVSKPKKKFLFAPGHK